MIEVLYNFIIGTKIRYTISLNYVTNFWFNVSENQLN